jgi:hypothetical protein
LKPTLSRKDSMTSEQLMSQFRREGFVILPLLNSHQFSAIRSIISRKWRHRLIEQYPHLESKIHDLDLADYHTIASDIDHPNLWTKEHRLFSHEEVATLLDIGILGNLPELLPDVTIVDIEGIGYPEIYWRLVRPGTSDVAPAHRDSWFWEITNNLQESDQLGLGKVWLPIITVPGQNGLGVYPNSKQWSIEPLTEFRHGRMKPVLPSGALDDKIALNLPVIEKECVLFDRKLFHFGIPHSIDRTRVSVEFAVRATALYS